jgi:hypothetical protein
LRFPDRRNKSQFQRGKTQSPRIGQRDARPAAPAPLRRFARPAIPRDRRRPRLPAGPGPYRPFARRKVSIAMASVSMRSRRAAAEMRRRSRLADATS